MRAQARTRFALGGLATLAAGFLAGCGDDPDEVDAQPVCAVDEGDLIRVVDAAECDRDDDGRQTVGGNVFWYHMPYGGTYAHGSRHPTSMSHSRLAPGTKGTSGYGKPGTTVVKVPARDGFGGSAVKGGSGGGGSAGG